MLAHQGGWDEILVVVGPMVVIGAVLAVARRRIGPVSDDATVDEMTADRSTDRSTDEVDQ